MKDTYLAPSDKKNLWFVIGASSVGTLIEWYDFYLFGSLATILATQFFPTSKPAIGFIYTLATFAAGFVVRPFGAIVFGRLGDLVGRKHTFLVTLILMGVSTFAIGLVPGYQQIGIAAPIIVLLLRLLQGLAMGGEYGGAATYVAEHAPAGNRGYFTSYIQTTATLGFFMSLGIILAIRQWVGEDAFAEWGWRIPFLISAVLVGISIYIRLKMAESPLFTKIKNEGKISANPIVESFGKKKNLKIVLLALFGATAGQGVVWYTGQFYALTFIQKTCGLELAQSYIIIAVALLLGTPMFIFFGRLSDNIGRKYIMMMGLLLAVLCYRPIYRQMYELSDLSKKVMFPESKSISRSYSPGKGSEVTVTTTHHFSDGTQLKETSKENQEGVLSPSKREINLSMVNFWKMVMLVLMQLVFVAMAYGPIAAFLVELFPTRIRYTSMSLPYHIGNGIFGGLTPFLATTLFEFSKTSVRPEGDPLAGLWYPIGVAAICFVVGMLFLKNKPELTTD